MAETFNIESIFKKYKDKVYRLALSMTENEKDAEDIIQNTFLKIIKNLRYFKNRSLLSTWIYRIAYNETLMSLRKRKSQFKLSDYLMPSQKRIPMGLYVNWPKLPDELLLGGEFKQRIDSAIKHMPIKYRMPLLLESIEGLPLKDCARVLNLKINSLKTRLHRARLIIKSEISDYFKDRQREEAKKARMCGTWIGFIYDYARGKLGKRMTGDFRKHIKDCPGCNSFLDTYLKAIDITHALECQDLPDELKDRIETFLFKVKKY